MFLFSVGEFQKFPELDVVFDDDDADDVDEDAGCWLQNGRGVVLEEVGRLDEKQTGACRLEPGIRFETGGDQRGLLVKAFTGPIRSSDAIAMHTSTAW